MTGKPRDDGTPSQPAPLTSVAEFAAALRNELNRAGLSLRALAKNIDDLPSRTNAVPMSHQTLSDLAGSGKRVRLPREPQLRTILAVCGTDLAYGRYLLANRTALERSAGSDSTPSQADPTQKPSAPAADGAADSAASVSPYRRLGLPARKYFHGRQTELEWISAPGVDAKLCFIVGLAGTGKTALVLEHVYRSMDAPAPPKLVWWIDASSRASLIARMAATYRLIAGDDLATAEDAAIALRIWLEEYSSDYILVFDNADAKSVLADVVPQSGKGRTIVTSRYQYWDNERLLRLDTLTPADAVTILEWRSSLQDPPGAERVAKELGYLALAVSQAAAYIARQHRVSSDYTYKKYIRVLRSNPNELHSRDFAGLSNTAFMSISASLRAVSPFAVHVIGMLSFLGVGDIPASLLDESRLRAVPALQQLSRFEFSEVIENLADYSLIDVGQSDHVDALVYRIHPLVQSISRLLSMRPQEHAIDMLNVMDATLRSEGGDERKVPLQYVPHVLALSRQIHLLRPPLELSVSDESRLAHLLYKAAAAMRQQVSYYVTATVMAARAARMFRNSLGASHVRYGYALLQLGVALTHLEHFKWARSCDEEAVRIVRDWPAAPVDLAWCLHDLAIDLGDIGARTTNESERSALHDRSRDLIAEGLELLQNDTSPHWGELAWFLSDSASLHEATGARSTARAELEEALHIVDTHLDTEDTRRGRIRVKLANHLCPPYSGGQMGDSSDMWDIERSERLHWEALRLFESRFGDAHELVARPLIGIARCVVAARTFPGQRITEAIAYLERASSILHKSFPPGHSSMSEVDDLRSQLNYELPERHS